MDINMDVLRPFIQDRKQVDGVANATINRALEIVRRILYLARDDWGWITRVPKIRMLKEPKRRVRFLKEEEADRLMEALPEHLVPVVRFALATGCRMAEILQTGMEPRRLRRRVAWLDAGHHKERRRTRDSPEPGCNTGVEKRPGQHERWCFTYQGEAHGSVGSAWKRALKRAGIENFQVPRPQPYLGELARDERNQSARADGVRRLEVVRDGTSVRAFGAGTFIGCGGSNRTGVGNRRKRLYDFSTLKKKGPTEIGKPL